LGFSDAKRFVNSGVLRTTNAELPMQALPAIDSPGEPAQLGLSELPRNFF